MEVATAVTAYAASEWKLAQAFWTGLRASDHFPHLSQYLLVGINARLGNVDEGRKLIAPFADNCQDDHYLLDANQLLTELARKQDYVASLTTPTKSLLDRVRYARQLTEARLLDHARSVWLELIREIPVTEAHLRLTQIAIWNGDWATAQFHNNYLRSIGEDRESLTTNISSAMTTLEEVEDSSLEHIARKFFGKSIIRAVSTASSTATDHLSSVRQDLEVLRLRLIDGLDPVPPEQAAVEIVTKAEPAASPTSTEPVAPSAPPKTSSARPSLPRSMMETSIPDLYYQAKNRNEISTQVSREGGVFACTASPKSGWLRFAVPIPGAELTEDDLVVELFLGANAMIASDIRVEAGVVIRNDLNLTVLGKISAKSTIGSSQIRWRQNCADLQKILASKDASALLLIFTVSGAAQVEISSFEKGYEAQQALRAQVEKISYPKIDALYEHNQALSAASRTGVEAWITKEAQLAVRLDCIETAMSLIDLLTSNCSASFVSSNKDFIKAAFDTYLATGRYDQILYLALVADPSVFQDIDVSTAYRIACRKLGYLSAPNGIAQTGLTNLYELSNADSATIFASVSSLQTQVYSDRLLVAANAARGISHKMYLSLVNRYLAEHDLLPFHYKGDLEPNILAAFHGDAIKTDTTRHQDKISVIMSCYNAEATVAYALRSLLTQSYSNLEILVCDDGSADNTFGVLEGFQDDRIRFFKSVQNQGPYNVRNALTALATGAFICFQDADDLAHPQRIALQVEAFGADPSIKGVLADGVRVRDDGKFVFFKDQKCQRSSTVSLMYPKAIVEEVGAFRSVVCGADSDYLERIRIRYGFQSVVLLRKPLVFSLWGSSSMTQQPDFIATEDSYKSGGRRELAEVLARQRILGNAIVSDEDVERVTERTLLKREATGVECL